MIVPGSPKSYFRAIRYQVLYLPGVFLPRIWMTKTFFSHGRPFIVMCTAYE